MTDPKPGALPSIPFSTPALWWPARWLAKEQCVESNYCNIQPMRLEHLCALVSALDDAGKREVIRACGVHVMTREETHEAVRAAAEKAGLVPAREP